MKTYQDLVASKDTKNFIISAINEYKTSNMYFWACEGEQYARQMNTTINRYQKLLYTMSGKAVPDNYSANHKCASNFFNRFVTQESQYLLGNGCIFEDENTKAKLGGNSFDTQLQKAGKSALVSGVAFGFFNFDHIDVFKASEFVPLWDEESGALKGGIRWWQISATKPLRATLYEIDGYTEYIRRDGQPIEVMQDKKPYKVKVVTSVADGTMIYDGGNYPSFPIVPLWGNPEHQSELVGLKGQIDAYDLIKSGFANDLDDCSMIYWTLQNAGGMDDVDLAKFIERMKTVKAATVDDEVKAEAHTMDVPYQSRETYLTRLENDMYNDAMALNVNQVSAGNVTATAINAAYEPLNNKTDAFEYCVIEFIQGILALAGIDDYPVFKRSKIVNMQEETQVILASAQYLDDETILKHLPFLSPDEVSGILDRKVMEEASRFEDAGADADADEDEDEDAGAEVENLMNDYGNEVIAMLNELLGEIE